MVIRACLIAACMGLANVAVAVGPSTTRAADDNVAGLIAQLDADAWQERDAAAAKLIAIGDSVRAAMVDAAAHAESPEVRSRAAAVIAKLDRLAADRPTEITLHVRDASPAIVFADIARQAGVAITYQPRDQGLPPKVTIDVDRQPFWTVMMSACGQARVAPGDLDDDGIRLSSSAESLLALPARTIDPRLMFIAVKATRSSELAYGPGHAVERDDQFRAKLFVDPKLRLLATHSATVEQAVDDHGGSLLPTTTLFDPASITFFSNGNVDTFTSTIVLPADSSHRLRRMAGYIGLFVGTRIERVELADVTDAAAGARVVGRMALRVTGSRIGAHDGSVNLAITYPGPAWQTPVYSSCRRIRLIDAAGEVLRTHEDRKEKDQRTDLAITYTGAKAVREPVRLVWDASTEWREMRAPFEFNDLPLP